MGHGQVAMAGRVACGLYNPLENLPPGRSDVLRRYRAPLRRKPGSGVLRQPFDPNNSQRHCRGETEMEVADLVLPVFAIIVTGWLAGWLGYISRSLADGLVHFAYNVAMPALLVVTIAQEP